MAVDITPATVKEVLQLTLKDTLDVGGPTEVPFDKTYETNFSFGVGDSKLNKLWWKQATLADGASEVIDIFALGTKGGIDANGIVAVKLLFIFNENANDGEDLVIGGAATEPWTGLFNDTDHQMRINAKETFKRKAPKATGIPVANAVGNPGHNLKIAADDTTANTNSVKYTIVIAGADATS